ncbi:MAG TPA: DUF4140 domain-containing protein, partial [Planctomycetota bacterium]|nr:DUF4140 domain-containing protein [Planctomycetota bacterium]
MHTLALALFAFQALPSGHPLETHVRDVTVFADRALVRRVADVPAGGGTFVVSGLPLSADPEQVRVRCVGGDVTDVDVTEVRAPALPDARREDLRRQAVELAREKAALEDERKLLENAAASVRELMNVDAAKPDSGSARIDLAGWSRSQDALLARLREIKQTLRELGERRAEVERRAQEVQQALGTADFAGGAVSREVTLDVVASAATVLVVEYVVSGAGWQPTYDLRAAADAKSTLLVY